MTSKFEQNRKIDINALQEMNRKKKKRHTLDVESRDAGLCENSKGFVV